MIADEEGLDARRYCERCSGTGEGQRDGSSCAECGGSGIVSYHDLEEGPEDE